MVDVACVDLFCGAGGLTHGLISEGIRVVAGVDVDEACRHPFEANNVARFINEDVGRLEQFSSRLNRGGFPSAGDSDSRCVLGREASRHGEIPVRGSAGPGD